MQKNIKKYMLVLLAVLLGVLLTVCAIPVAQWLSIPENRSLVWQKIDALGPWGAVIFLVIQILQVVIAFIPGEPVELAAGLLYGTWGGLLICLTGILLGSSMIFAVVRRFGRPLVQRLVDEESTRNSLPHRCPQAGHPDFPDVPDPRHPERHPQLPLSSHFHQSGAIPGAVHLCTHSLGNILHLRRSQLR